MFAIFQKIYHSRTHAHLIVASSDSIYLRRWGPPRVSHRIYANILYSGMSFSHCATETLQTVECSYSYFQYFFIRPCICGRFWTIYCHM